MSLNALLFGGEHVVGAPHIRYDFINMKAMMVFWDLSLVPKHFDGQQYAVPKQSQVWVRAARDSWSVAMLGIGVAHCGCHDVVV